MITMCNLCIFGGNNPMVIMVNDRNLGFLFVTVVKQGEHQGLVHVWMTWPCEHTQICQESLWGTVISFTKYDGAICAINL